MKKLLYSLFVFSYMLSSSQTQLFTIEDGLSNKDITCILQTKNGFLWVGTSNGLNLYDGYTFKEYNRENGLPNTKIKCLFEDENHLLWIGTWQGLCILNQKTGETKNYFITKELQKGITSSEVTAIERITDGSILVGYGNGTLLKFTDPYHYSKVYQLEALEEVFKSQVFGIKPLPDSSVVLITNYAVITKLDKNLKKDPVFKIYAPGTIGMDITDNHQTLVLTDGLGKVSQISPKNGTLINDKPSLNVGIDGDRITAAYLNDQRILWTGYGQGFLMATDLSSQKTINYSEQVKRFINGGPSCIYQDRRGIVWIGTNYGLIKFCPKKTYFQNYLFAEIADYKERNSIRGLLEDANGDIYIGGYNGLFKIDFKHKKVKRFLFKDLEKWQVTAYYPYRLLDDKNYIWITSEVRGLYAFNKTTENLEFPVSKKDFFRAFALLPKDSDELWVGSQNGLFIFNKIKKSLRKYSNKTSALNISDIEVTDLVRDAGGNVWIASYASGIFKMDVNQKITNHYSEATIDLAINFVSALYSENDSILWAGTRGGGLFRLNTKTDKVRNFTKKNGLADNSVAGILQDNDGNFWISTFNGLSKYSPQTNKFENYYDKDGLTDNEFNIAAKLKSRDGRLYFGGLNGINVFDPKALKKEQQEKAPEIYLSRFVKYQGETDKLLEQSGDLTFLDDLKLSYKDKFFSFNFSLDDYSDPHRNTFFYKLEGYDVEWTNLGTQNTIRFNTLPAGEYTLKIKGINSEGVPSKNELSIRLSVSEPFYTSWWFYLLILLAVIALAYGIAQYRIYQILKIRKLRTKISSDLHDEVGSLLTRITIQAELMKQGISDQDPVKEVSKIADTSRLATAAMSDVLWSIDARNDKVGDLITRLREQAGEILFPLEIEVDFTARNIDPEKQIDISVRQNLFLIFKEAIHNIAKHSKATHVTILLENRLQQFTMQIQDNGTSPKHTSGKQRQGLRNMNMRAELMEGVLEVKQGKGFQVLLKIKKL